jgi:hypothetical protein
VRYHPGLSCRGERYPDREERIGHDDRLGDHILELYYTYVLDWRDRTSEAYRRIPGSHFQQDD